MEVIIVMTTNCPSPSGTGGTSGTVPVEFELLKQVSGIQILDDLFIERMPFFDKKNISQVHDIAWSPSRENAFY